ncbi:WD40 repeat-like protein [Suillus hirtellus]|nr:WD40 repeat-like protein [Suillus hirtellus]
MASSSKQPGITANTSVLTPVMTLEGHKPYVILEFDDRELKFISYISYFPDGKQMISGSLDKTIRRWDLREGKEIKEAREYFQYDVHGVGVSRDGRWVVTVVDGVLKVCEVETGIVRTFHDGCNCIDISVNNLLAGVSYDGIRIWSLDTSELVAGPFRFSGKSAGALGLSQDSRKLAATSFDWESKQSYLEVWDIQPQKLVVARKRSMTSLFLRSLVFWTTKGKFITTLFSSLDDDMSIYEYDASTLKTVGDSFQGHTDLIRNLALSFDCLLLASASDDNTIKLWSFESRQLLASFDVQAPYTLILSPDSHQLAYTTFDEARIYVCDIPANIFASIGLAKETSAHLAKLLDSDATRHPVRRKPALSVIPSGPRPLAVTIEPRRPVIIGFLRKLLPPRTDMARPIRTNEPRNPLDFPATAPLPRSIVNPHDDNCRFTTTQSSAPTPTTFKSRLSTWWSLQTNHASPAIVDVPLAQGKERNAAAGAPRRKNDEWIPDEDHVSSPPSPNPDSRQPTTAGQVKTNAGEHGSSGLCFCF